MAVCHVYLVVISCHTLCVLNELVKIYKNNCLSVFDQKEKKLPFVCLYFMFFFGGIIMFLVNTRIQINLVAPPDGICA